MSKRYKASPVKRAKKNQSLDLDLVDRGILTLQQINSKPFDQVREGRLFVEADLLLQIKLKALETFKARLEGKSSIQIEYLSREGAILLRELGEFLFTRGI